MFQVAAALPAELGAGSAQVVGAEALDSNLLRRLLDYGPDRPVAQALADLPALRDRSQQPAVFDACRGHPGVDSLLDPDRYGDGAYASSLPFEVGQDPAALPLLDGLDIERGQFLPPQGAANQQRQDHVIAFALQCRAVRNGEQLFGLLAGEPVSQPGSLLADVWDVGKACRLFLPRAGRRALPRRPSCARPRVGH